MSNRRKFLKQSGTLLGGIGLLSIPGISNAEQLESFQIPTENLNEEDFWNYIRNSYTVSSNLINLNNGGVSPQPKVVQEVFEHYNRLSNEAPSYYMWRILDKGREDVRRDLAQLAGTDANEISICRNATEAIDIAIFGIDLKKGDEVLVTNYDYPNMRHAWMQREKREGIKLNWIDIPIGEEDNQKIIELFNKAITSKTKVVHITHMINWTGQLLPAKEITAIAHQKGAQVILDAAHSFAHVDFSLHDLDVDYAGTSLHKWLCAPFGTGMLYVKKNRINQLWPTMPNDKPLGDGIIKYEALGTRSFPAEMAIGRSIEFHNMIGIKRKEQRLRQLKNYWVNKVKGLKGIQFYSTMSHHNSCAICTVGFENKKAQDLENHLMNTQNIHVVSIEWEKVNGVRITPHVYTSFDDLDKLVTGLQTFVS